MTDNGDENSCTKPEISQGPDNEPRLEPPSNPSDPTRRNQYGRTSPEPQDSHEGRDSRSHLTPVRDSVRDRSTARVPRLEDPSETLLQAFVDGEFETAYASAQQLADAYHEALLESSQLRFKVNFGTERCANCTGLHAGPGIIATCYQIQRCDYANVKEGQEGPRKKRILQRLLT